METWFYNRSNQSANSTNTSVKIYGDKTSKAFAGLSMGFSAWIIVINIFVLICLVKHRKVMIKSTFTTQILTVSFNDVMAGISTLLICVTYFTTEVTYEFCIFQCILSISAQEVVLFHILGICIYRFLTLCQVTLPQRRRNQGSLIAIYLLVIWIVTLIILTSTFIIWGKHRHALDICSLNEIFQNNYKTVISYWVWLLIVPAVLTNVIYLAMTVRLSLYARKIAHVNNLSAPQPSSSNCTNSYNFLASNETNRNKTDGVAHNDRSCRNATREGQVSCSCNQPKRDLWANTRSHSKATNDTKTSDINGEGKKRQQIRTEQPSKFQESKTSSDYYR